MKKTQKILVPTDFSRHGEAALARACELADREQQELHVIHVVQGAITDDKRRVAYDQLSRTIEPHLELKLDVHREVVAGVPYKAIVDYARQHDMGLIVIGTAGRTGLAHLVLGSTSERVLRFSTCPVLVVKADESSVSQ